MNLTSPNTKAEVILEDFDLDPALTVLTVIDDEGNPATVTLDDSELDQILNWIHRKLSAPRTNTKLISRIDVEAARRDADEHLSFVAEVNRPGDPD